MKRMDKKIQKTNEYINLDNTEMSKNCESLQIFFGLSYASFLTLPRLFMEAMPVEWQEKMADLLFEFQDEFDLTDLPNPIVQARNDNKFVSWPKDLLNYRHPNINFVESYRIKKEVE